MRIKSFFTKFIQLTFILVSFNSFAMVEIHHDSTSKMIEFSIDEINRAMANQGKSVLRSAANDFSLKANKIFITPISNQKVHNLFVAQGGLPIGTIAEQGYAIRTTQFEQKTLYWVFGRDELGTMYGGLRLAELIEQAGLTQVKDESESPHIKQRGIKFNIPLDVRTPSFADIGRNSDFHREVVWDLEFWYEWLDDLARYRYNFLSLWNRNPFPNLVKLDKYPDVAMPDVHNDAGLVKKMSMDEKIQFWNKVIDYAKDRGIKVIWINWNIHLDHAKNFDLVESGLAEKTKDYLRESTKALLRSYPNLYGIGITAGERMRELESAEQKEQWLIETYGQAILEVAKEQPEREFMFMHRYWWTSFDNIVKYFKPVIEQPNIQFDLSFKYARARLYSAPNPTFAQTSVLKTLPSDLRIWWNLRNDDVLTFRWGDPDYVKSYIKNLPPEHQTAGIHMGSDRYVWGKEMSLKSAGDERQLQTKFNWYRFMLWGRLSYNPNLSNDVFEANIKVKHPNLNSEKLMQAWQDASQSFPLATKYHWHDWDYMWHVETSSGYDAEITGLRATKRFYDVLSFIDNKTMEDSGLLTIPEFVKLYLKGEEPSINTPFSHAKLMKHFANRALDTLPSIKMVELTQQETELLNDIEAMSFAGLYYAYKIEAATYHALYTETKNAKFQQLAIQHMLRSYKAWAQYIAIFRQQYDLGKMSILTREVDFDELLESVQKDVELVGGHYKDKIKPI